MADANFQNVVDEVIDKNDICDVISEYAKLKRMGNRFAALCPLHNDKKSPSLSVSFTALAAARAETSFILLWRRSILILPMHLNFWRTERGFRFPNLKAAVHLRQSRALIKNSLSFP